MHADAGTTACKGQKRRGLIPDRKQPLLFQHYFAVQ